MMRKVVLILSLLCMQGVLACDLQIESAWIRVAPGNAATLAGYAVLSNHGSQAVSVAEVQSAAFARIDLHESLIENGMAKMRAIDKLQIAAGGRVEFAPGGKHFMMMNPKRSLRSGDAVAVKLKDSKGCETTVQFQVSMGPAAADAMDHAKMDHSNMDHAAMSAKPE